MINDGITLSEIASALNIKKSHVSYYVKRAKQFGYVKECFRDRIKVLELTQPGANFLDQYEKHHAHPPYRLENIRFKARVITMPTISVDWDKVEMNNWSQYGFKVDDIKVRLNSGNNPSIEFIPSGIDGDDPYKLQAMANYDCMQVAKKLEETLGMKIGRIELSSRAEYVVYDPIAKEFCKHNGQITVDGIGKVNASKPRRIGEFEFYDVRRAAEYMAMPRRISDLEQYVKEILSLLKNKKESNSEGDDKKSESS